MKMWEIRENDDYREPRYGRRMGYKSPEDKAYECGYEDGYKDAMEKMSAYGEKRGGSMMR